MRFVYPKALQPGDTIATVSLSSGLAGMHPQVYAVAKDNLERLFGLRVIEAPHSQRDESWLYNNPEARADDLHWALENPSVAAIVSNIGGYESVRTLPFLNSDSIRQHPKLFLGYSDSTVHHTAFYNAGVVSFSGPAMMSGVAQLKAYPYMQTALEAALFGKSPFAWSAANHWSEENVRWEDPDFSSAVHLPLGLHSNDGWVWLQGQGRVSGHGFGGCIEVLEMLKSTAWWPSPDSWDGAVLYLESSEEVPPPTQIEYWLRNYASQGVLQRCAALLVARPRGYTPGMKLGLYQIIQKILKEISREDLPVVANLDFGHTMPMVAIPNGGQIDIDCRTHSIVLHHRKRTSLKSKLA